MLSFLGKMVFSCSHFKHHVSQHTTMISAIRQFTGSLRCVGIGSYLASLCTLSSTELLLKWGREGDCFALQSSYEETGKRQTWWQQRPQNCWASCWAKEKRGSQVGSFRVPHQVLLSSRQKDQSCRANKNKSQERYCICDNLWKCEENHLCTRTQNWALLCLHHLKISG